MSYGKNWSNQGWPEGVGREGWPDPWGLAGRVGRESVSRCSSSSSLLSSSFSSSSWGFFSPRHSLSMSARRVPSVPPPSLHVPWADIPSAAFPRAHRAQWLGAAGKLTPNAPVCCRRTSRRQQRRREIQSERARLLPGHIALSALLARSSFRMCRLAPCRCFVNPPHAFRTPPSRPLRAPVRERRSRILLRV